MEREIDQGEGLQRPVARMLGEGKAISVIGDIYRFLATGEDTGGTYSVFEAIIPPGGGPPKHIHHRENEAFYIVEGELIFELEDQTIHAQQGFFVHLPRGAVHAFRNQGQTPARLLVWVVPSGLEKFLERVGQPVLGRQVPPLPTTQEAFDQVLEVAPEYGIEIIRPK